MAVNGGVGQGPLISSLSRIQNQLQRFSFASWNPLPKNATANQNSAAGWGTNIRIEPVGVTSDSNHNDLVRTPCPHQENGGSDAVETKHRVTSSGCLIDLESLGTDWVVSRTNQLLIADIRCASNPGHGDLLLGPEAGQ